MCHVITSVETEKVLTKTQHSVTIKTPSNLAREGNFFNLASLKNYSQHQS